jgi:hypothetical protein
MQSNVKPNSNSFSCANITKQVKNTPKKEKENECMTKTFHIEG